MLNELCAECKNYFLRNVDKSVHYGTWTIADGTIQTLPFLMEGQYYRIVGSTFNDGVYCYGDQTLTLADETFEGSIWAMAVPRDFVELAREIEQWTAENAATIDSPYQSEAFGGYSYTKAIAGTGQLSSDWQAHFAARLKPYRRISVL